MQVEKVSYNIDWKRFKIGTSIFIPCLDIRLAKRQVMQVMNRLKFKVVIKVAIEEGIRGLRIWRTC